MSKNRVEQTTVAPTAGETENLNSGVEGEQVMEQNIDPNTGEQTGAGEGVDEVVETGAETGDPSIGTGDEVIDQGILDPNMMPPDEPVKEEPAPVAIATQVADTAPAPAAEVGEWAEMRAQVLAKNLPAVNRLIAVLETFEGELGNTSTYGNPAMFEAGASKTFSMYTRLVAAINDVPPADIRVAWYTLLGFIRNHQKRYDAYSPMMLFRFQPYWSHGAEVAKEFEMFMTTVIESSKTSLAEVGKSYPVAKHLAPLVPATASAVLALYA